MGIGVVLVGIGCICALLCVKHPSPSAKMNRNLKGMRMAAYQKRVLVPGELTAIIILRSVSAWSATHKHLRP